MKAHEMRRISEENQPWIRILSHIRNEILKAAQAGDFTCRASCDENYELYIFDNLRKDGYSVKGILREAGRIIFEVSWE